LSSSSTSTELWPNRSSGPTRAVRSKSKPMGYLHQEALGIDPTFGSGGTFDSKSELEPKLFA
jgi:hypothetical protein